MGKLFGTDGVRGIANRDLTADLALKLGCAGALVASHGKRKGRILVGRDTRLSGDFLEAALIAGILSTGADVLRVGVLPTPAIAFLTKEFGSDAGVVISASHNPVEDNGIKFFNGQGFKLSDEEEERIEKLVFGGESSEYCKPVGKEVGRTFSSEEEAKGRYAEHLLQTIRGNLKGLRVAIDCANGSSFEIAPMVFQKLGAEVLSFNTEPDGVNINVNCGSTNPDCIRRIVEESRADLGLAFDGDADRVIAVDSDGNILDGDFIIAICADCLNRQGALAKSTVATTIMTNFGFDLAMRERGINVVKTDVGDRLVLEEMLKRGLNLGGEQSGHIIFLEHATTGDGIITALQLLSIVKETGLPLKELRKIMTRWPQALVNVQIENGERLEKAKRVWEQVRIFEKKLQDRGRILLRPSGTEPLIRVMVETESTVEANAMAEELASMVREELG